MSQMEEKISTNRTVEVLLVENLWFHRCPRFHVTVEFIFYFKHQNIK